MKRKLVVLIAAALTAAMAGTALAHPATPRADKREARQRVRIAHGVESGQLTRAEAKRARAGQRHIRRVERRAKRDGIVTKRERRHLNRALDHESRAIRRLKHNARHRR